MSGGWGEGETAKVPKSIKSNQKRKPMLHQFLKQSRVTNSYQKVHRTALEDVGVLFSVK